MSYEFIHCPICGCSDVDAEDFTEDDDTVECGAICPACGWEGDECDLTSVDGGIL